MSRTSLLVILPPFILGLLLAGCATSPASNVTPEVDPLRLGNPKAPFAVTLQSEQPSLRAGERLGLRLQAATNGYLNLYFISAAGNTGQLFTNYPIRADETVFFPPATSKRLYYAPTASTGVETFILVATQRPLNLFGRRDIRNAKRPRTPIAEFNLTDSQLLSRLRAAMRQWPPRAWNAASIRLPLLSPTNRLVDEKPSAKPSPAAPP